MTPLSLPPSLRDITLPTLSAARVSLRHMTDADLPAIFAIFSNADVMRYWSSIAFQQMDEARDLLKDIHAKFVAGTLFQWGIVRHEDDEVIGTFTLYRVDLAHGRAEIGYALRRSAWGHGFATEAVRCGIDFAFQSLKLHRLEADVDPRNLRSIAMLERLGFRREGLLRERYIVNGEMQDTVYLGLLRSEYVDAAER